MSRRFVVSAHTTASASLTVILDDADLARVAGDLGVAVADLTTEQLAELVTDRAFREGFPSVCAQCSGWGRSYNLNLGEDWEVDDGDDAVWEVTDSR